MRLCHRSFTKHTIKNLILDLQHCKLMFSKVMKQNIINNLSCFAIGRNVTFGIMELKLMICYSRIGGILFHYNCRRQHEHMLELNLQNVFVFLNPTFCPFWFGNLACIVAPGLPCSLTYCILMPKRFKSHSLEPFGLPELLLFLPFECKK